MAEAEMDDGNGAPEADDSVRASLEAAFDAAEAPETPPAPVAPPAAAPSPTQTPAEALKGSETAPKAPTDAPTAQVKAPSAWKPALREKWAGLDPEVRTEVMRREKEIENGLRQAADARKLAAEFEKTIAPFQQFIQADNSTPLRAVQNLMQTAATLRVGTPMQKAQVAAEIIKNFGIDVQTLDNLLAGNMVQQDPVEARIQAALAPVQQLLQQQQSTQTARMEQLHSTVTSELDTFAADPQNEFFEDVRQTMADLLDVASAQGKTLDLQTAYKRAILMHDDIAPIVAERELKQRAQQASIPAQRARQRAVSVIGAPSMETTQPKSSGNMRDDIMRAIEQLEAE